MASCKPEDWVGRSFDNVWEELTMKQVVNVFSCITASLVEYVQLDWDVYEQKAGKDMTIMVRWELADMLTLEEYLIQGILVRRSIWLLYMVI